MSDNLHTYIEPELEARITALVLGEVSEFDVEELERMIEQQPELQIFRRRMEAMHALLGETVKPEKDAAWQLSDDRRSQLRRTFARQEEPAFKPSRTVSQAQWRSVIGVAACVVVCLVIFSVMDPLESPESDLRAPQIISYQVGVETNWESSFKENRSGPNQLRSAGRDEPMVIDHLKNDLEVDSFASLTESPREKKMEQARGRTVLLKTDLPKEVIEGTPRPLTSSRLMTDGVERIPVAPSSSTAKAIASNTNSPTAIPLPDRDVPDPSTDFGDSSGFGYGRAGASEGVVTSGRASFSGKSGALAMSEGEDDPFGGSGGRGRQLSRGSHKSEASNKSDASDLSRRKNQLFFSENESLATNKMSGKKGAFPATPAIRSSFETRDMELPESGGGFAFDMDQVADANFSKRPQKLRGLTEAKISEDRPVEELLAGGIVGSREKSVKAKRSSIASRDGVIVVNGSIMGLEAGIEAGIDAVAGLSDQRVGDNYSDDDGSDKNGSIIVEARKSGYLSSVRGDVSLNLLAEVEDEEQTKKPEDVSSPLVILGEKLGLAGLQDGLKDELRVKNKRIASIAEADKKSFQPAKQLLKRKRKRPQALPEETRTSTQPFSTFSLNVSDVSFKLAKAALLEKGQWPQAAKVRTEEFVNAFDYGDPSPRRGESVACAIEQSTHPFLQQRNLLRIGMKTAALGRSTPLRLTVLLDNSGSMEREDREASVLAAIRVLAAQLGPQDKITLVSFARQPRLLADRISGDKADQLVNIVANTPSEGGTNIEEALRLARTLAKRQHTEGAQDRIVLITDGVANLGNTVPEELSREIETLRQEGIAFDACGVGAEGLNDDILEALTRKGDGRYYFLNRPEDADSGFAKQLAGALSPAAKNVKVQVVFNPKRVSKYRLLGFEKHRLNKEDFRNDRVDAAEMAAEEAGNAVYQINTIPDGEGELGEVFVRFQDTNTGRMVERSWSLPYESQAKRFSEATPAMQLAGTASMLGEKLHGTDAGSVRFSMISNTLGKLRAHYTADRKVQDLIRMCEKVE